MKIETMNLADLGALKYILETRLSKELEYLKCKYNGNFMYIWNEYEAHEDHMKLHKVNTKIDLLLQNIEI